SIIRTTQPATPRSNSTSNSIGFEWLENVAQNTRSLRWSKHRRAPHTSGAGIDVEVTTKLLISRFRVFERSEVLLHVSNRTEQALLFATPQRHSNRTTRFNSE